MSDFTLDDFLKMESFWRGSKNLAQRLHELSSMMPGIPKLNLGFLSGMEQQIRRSFEIVRKMSPAERKNPALIDDDGRARIARDAGATPADVDTLLHAFHDLTEMLRNLEDATGPIEGFANQAWETREWNARETVNEEWEYLDERTDEADEEFATEESSGENSAANAGGDAWDQVDWPDAEWDYKPENDSEL